MRIRTKITLSFLIGAIVLIGLTVPISFTINKNNLEKVIFAHLRTITNSKVREVEEFLEDQEDAFALLRKSETLRVTLENYDEGKQALLTKAFREVMKINEEWYEIFVLDKDGKVVVTTNPKELSGTDFSSDELFIKGEQEPFIKSLFFDEEFKTYGLAVSGPVYGANNEVIGVLIARIKSESLNEITEKSVELGETGEVILVDKEGYMITASKYVTDTLLREKLNESARKHCFEGHSGQEGHPGHVEEGVYVGYRDVEVLSAHENISKMDWCLLAEMEEKEAFAPIAVQRNVVLGILSTAPFLAFLIGYLITKEITKPAAKLIEGAQKIGEGDFDYKIDINTKDETKILAEAFNKMSSNLKKSVVSIKSITKEKNKIDAILHSIHDGVLVVDENFTIIIFNDMATEISGFTREEAIGKKFFDVLKFVQEKDGKVNDSFIRDTIKEGRAHEMAAGSLLIKKNGENVAVSDSAAPLRDEEGKVVGCVVVFKDVTKEREIGRMKDEFINIAAHDLRTPATAIKGYLSMLIDGDVGQLSKQVLEMIRGAYDGNERLISLIDDFLTVARVERGKIVISPKKTDLTKLIDISMKELKDQADEKGLTLEYKRAKLPPVWADDERTIEVLHNLIGNAIKFTNQGGVTIYHEISEREIITNISDTGPGISEDMKMNLFKKYQRGGEKTNVTGLGLGLYISRLIIEGSGGKIWATSEENKGATFSFSLIIVK